MNKICFNQQVSLRVECPTRRVREYPEGTRPLRDENLLSKKRTSAKARRVIFLILCVGIIIFSNLITLSALSVVVHVPEKYTEVVAGERFYFEIEVKYPENPKRKDLRLEYEISKEEEVIAHSKVLKAIETQASFMDFIVIPARAEDGLYLINVRITDYESLSEEVSASFYVHGENDTQLKVYFFILLGVVILVGLLVLVQIFNLRRK